ncbi:hypothetical protein DV738_g5236, partial [Chaetothyriales sp. CBS 135597]
MRIWALTALLLAIALAAVYTTTVDHIISDIIAIDRSVKALTSAVSQSDGGLYSKAVIAALFAVVSFNTAKGGIDARFLPRGSSSSSSSSSVVVDAADAERVIATVRETLDITNPRAVKAFEAKKAHFQSWGQDVVVAAALRLILHEHLFFSNAVLERTPAGHLADATDAVDIISKALEAGIATFNS